MEKEFNFEGINTKLIKKLAEIVLNMSNRTDKSIGSLSAKVDSLADRVDNLEDMIYSMNTLSDDDDDDILSKEEFTENLKDILDDFEFGYFETEPNSKHKNCIVIPIDDNYKEYLEAVNDDCDEDDDCDDECSDCDDCECCCGCCDDTDAIDEIQAIADKYDLDYDIIGDEDSGEALVIPITDDFNISDCDKAYTIYERVKAKCTKGECKSDCGCCSDSDDKGDDCDGNCEKSTSDLASDILKSLLKSFNSAVSNIRKDKDDCHCEKDHEYNVYDLLKSIKDNCK